MDSTVKNPMDHVKTRREYKRFGLPKSVNMTPNHGIENQRMPHVHCIESFVICYRDLHFSYA